MSEASAQSWAFSLPIRIIVLTAMFCMASNVRAAEDLHSAPHVQKNISDNEHALLKGDVDVVLSFTHPRIIEMLGGREAARVQMLNSIVATIKATGMEIISFTFPAPPQFLSSGGNEFVIVPTLSVVRFAKTGKRVESLNFQVGMLDPVTKSWKYVEGSRVNEQVKALLLPGFPPDFKMPQFYRKLL
jgi:hypothetical protein